MKDRLKLLRKELRITQQELADRVGISRGNIAAYEVGKNSPSDAVISLICREFNVNEEWLRTGAGEMFIEETPDEEFMRMAKAVASGDTRADRMIRKTLMCFIQNLADSRQENPAAGMPKTPEELEGKYPPVDIKAKSS